jgi:DNA-binding transcriptional MerR regulator
MALQQILFPMGEELPGNRPPDKAVPSTDRPEQSDAAKEAFAEIPPPLPKKAAGKGTRGRKSVKELAATVDLVEIPPDEILFQKQYYGIGEVAAMFKVNTSLIRFWETEFSEIKPRKNKKGDRYFSPADIKILQLIHFLLRAKKLTIEGAKEYLKAHNQDGTSTLEMIHALQRIKAFLLELKAGL